MQTYSRLTDPKNRNLIKYSVILIVATSLSGIAYSNPPLNWVFKGVARGDLNLHQQWMNYSDFPVSGLMYWFFLQVILSFGLVAPFVLAVVGLLHLLKCEWLPEGDAFVLKPLIYWLACCLFLFLSTLTTQTLEGLGVIKF